MTLAECHRILLVEEGASPEAIKSSYRKLAFTLHPDLNPDDPEAGRKFQRLNEAYVILTRTGKPSSDAGTASGKARARKPSRPAEPRAGEEKRAKEAYAEEAARNIFRRKSADAQDGTAGFSFEFRKEEVLKDILRDPFARKVFEDIYAQVRQSTGKPLRRLGKRSLELDMGGRTLKFDLSQGVVGGIKSWLRGQLDDEHVAHLPVASLLPGRTVRLKVRLGLSGEEKQIEVTLPADFVPGKPIRLKGLGRHLGPFKGDLYLRIMPK